MKTVSKNYDTFAEALIIFVILLSSTTGWYLIDFLGMSYFWLIFIGSTFLIVYLFYRKINILDYFKNFFKNKLNIIIILYLVWISITYLVNFIGKSSILYIGKAWVLVSVYLIISQAYFNNLSKDRKYKFIFKCAKSIFYLGIVLSIVGLYQFVYNSNKVFGIIVSDWPSYNPASMYGNVNGFGTYLFFSIVSGVYLFVNNIESKVKYSIGAIVVAQIYIMYLTVARTSIVITIIYLIVNFTGLCVFRRNTLKKLFNFKMILILIFANIAMVCILNMSDIKQYFSSKPIRTTERKASDMLAEKNSKGVNSRQLIWKAVLSNYEEYVITGDGLKYNILKRINPEEVISKRSKGVDRISYHNTLFRYFASNGILGLILFLALYSYVPLKIFKGMRIRKEYSFEFLNLLTFLLCIFLYMQMEEVYLGEVGLVPIITCLMISFSNSFIELED